MNNEFINTIPPINFKIFNGNISLEINIIKLLLVSILLESVYPFTIYFC